MAPVLEKPTVTDVGVFIRARVIADTRQDALRATRRAVEEHGYKVVDLAQATPQSSDEWLVEVRVVAR